MEKRKYKFEDVKEYLMSDNKDTFQMGWIMFKQHIWVQGLSYDELFCFLKNRSFDKNSGKVNPWLLYYQLPYKDFYRFKLAVNKEYQKRNKIIKYELIE
jgi:hypothetical protein